MAEWVKKYIFLRIQRQMTNLNAYNYLKNSQKINIKRQSDRLAKNTAFKKIKKLIILEKKSLCRLKPQ